MSLERAGTFDLVLVGTGFASSFFLHRYLKLVGPRARVLVLERGEIRDHPWQLAHPDDLASQAKQTFANQNPTKPWVFRLAFGGGSGCWWACTSRFLPEDFRLRSLYGVGQDWPLTYDDLEEYYCDTEEIMEVAGPSDRSPYPRSRPYPQPPHRLSDPDRLLLAANPDLFFHQPAARPSRQTLSGRPRCCASGVCGLCPIDSKFTVLNELKHLYDDPRVTLLLGATALGVEIANTRVTGVRYQRSGAEYVAGTDVAALGANAIFNPHILLRSGLDDPALGRGLVEQVSANVVVDLDGVDNFQGSTSITGLGYMAYAGDHRRERAAALMQAWNVPELRNERGKWRQRLVLKFVFEDLRQATNRVAFNAASPDKPDVIYTGPSEYLNRGIESLDVLVPRILAALPVTGYKVKVRADETESHILGTAPMGNNAGDSIVDRDLVHHRVRNLLVLGSSAFPTTTPAAPTLTISALSLRAADRLLARH